MKFISKILLFITLTTPLSAFALFEECRNFFPNQQVPTSPEVGRDLCFDSFAVLYSPRDKKPIYTIEKLNRLNFAGSHPRRTNQFYEEARLPIKERALLSDYRGSGYDRGHNVPAGDMSDERGMAQSFSLANMMPQARQNNQGIWAKNVEEPTRQYVKRTSGDLYIYTGSTGNIGNIGKSQVTIPAHLYKLIYDPSRKTAWAYWVDNTNEANMSPPISYLELVEKTGIDFHLPIETKTSSIHPSDKPITNSSPLIGGWYPVFFDEYSPGKANEIVATIKEGKVASIQIQYDQNQGLATRLAQYIESQTDIRISLTQNSPPESATVAYERNRVTAIVHTK